MPVKTQNHINIELNKATVEFLATDIGKIIAVIAICVAMVMGAGPIILEGLKQAMLAAKAGAQYAIKAGAKYIAKQMTVKAMAKRAAGYIVKKVAQDYAEGKAEKAEAEYAANLEAQYEREYEAMIEKQYREAYGVDFAAAIETPKAQVLGPDRLPIPHGMPYKYVPLVPPTSQGYSGPSQATIDQFRFGTAKQKEDYLIKKSAYLKSNPKIAQMYEATKHGLAAGVDDLTAAAASIDENERAELMDALDRAIAEATQLSNSPEIKEVADKLREQGYTEQQIDKTFKESQLYRDATGAIMYQTALPAVSTYVDNIKEYPPEIAEDVKIIIAKKVADNETNKAVNKLNGGGITPLLLIGGIAALMLG